MSLETHLDLNNKLLTQHNALLEQLLAALAAGGGIRQINPDTTQQEYREAGPEAAPEPEPEPETTGPEQDTAALFEQARSLVMKLTTGGCRHEAVEILNKFGAQKLGQVPQENLADVVKLAEQALAES